MGQTQVEIVGEALGIPAYVLIADVGLPVIGSLMAVILGGVNTALFSMYLWQFYHIEQKVRLSTVSAAFLFGLADVCVLCSFIYDKCVLDPDGDFKIQHGEYFGEGLFNFMAQGLSQFFFLHRLVVFPSLRASPLIVFLGFAIAVETLSGIVSEALAFGINDYREENNVAALDLLRVFPLVLGIIIDTTITFKLITNIRAIDIKFSGVKKVLERHNMIACAAMTLIATGCALIFAVTRSVGMMSILRLPLPQVNILCMLVTLLSRQKVRREVPSSMRKRPTRRVFSSRRSISNLPVSSAITPQIVHYDDARQERQFEGAVVISSPSPDVCQVNTLTSSCSRSNGKLSDLSLSSQLYQFKTQSSPSRYSTGHHEIDHERQYDKEQDQDYQPRQSSADRSLYHRSSLLGP